MHTPPSPYPLRYASPSARLTRWLALPPLALLWAWLMWYLADEGALLRDPRALLITALLGGGMLWIESLLGQIVLDEHTLDLQCAWRRRRIRRDDLRGYRLQQDGYGGTMLQLQYRAHDWVRNIRWPWPVDDGLRHWLAPLPDLTTGERHLLDTPPPLEPWDEAWATPAERRQQHRWFATRLLAGLLSLTGLLMFFLQYLPLPGLQRVLALVALPLLPLVLLLRWRGANDFRIGTDQRGGDWIYHDLSLPLWVTAMAAARPKLQHANSQALLACWPSALLLTALAGLALYAIAPETRRVNGHSLLCHATLAFYACALALQFPIPAAG
ncbi:hypothetical protein SAMN02745857_00836 [Andreprevotia lacus DSM 23236]|jgi:hypothetical protein|uniref:PH domain-containing protein n=1 Tax=Andreprevotia lacus DSM 23236 TaxID=1121001 RepID=A0A1W1X851_9NEIS|nr:hypothetical protein [Andreprevotia lacus]SMC20155.1 hypothetical protein SAMN02745857_00836 [Andreprevotia lacus DSM 23236]